MTQEYLIKLNPQDLANLYMLLHYVKNNKLNIDISGIKDAIDKAETVNKE